MNRKKLLPLLVSLALCLGLTMPAAGAAFTDQAEIQNPEAVAGCVTLGIISGFPEGDFRPNDNVTRGQMAKLICVVVNGGQAPDLSALSNKTTFTDVGGNWAKDYITYCASKGIVSGMGDGTFAPESSVTPTQAAKMLLVTLGYDAQQEGFNGPLWAQSVEEQATNAALYDGLAGVDRSKPLSRDNAARMIWNALHACEVSYVDQPIVWEGEEITVPVALDRRGEDGSLLSLLKDKFGLDALPGDGGESPGDGQDDDPIEPEIPDREDHL